MTRPTTAIRLETALAQTLQRAIAACGWTLEPLPAATLLESPRDGAFGDLACAIALKLSRQAKRPPLDVAQTIIAVWEPLLEESGLRAQIERIEIAPPGFINLSLSRAALYDALRRIREVGDDFGRSTLGAGQRVSIEFCSANPTGGLSVAHGRQAAIGDALARLMRFAGHDVTCEYYLNDEGHQIDVLGRSIRSRYGELIGGPFPFPDDGYRGAYVADIARAMHAEHGAKFLEVAEAEALPVFSRFGMHWVLARIREDLARFGVRFDVWSSQQALRAAGAVEQTLAQLRQHGLLYEQDGALWFASTKFGDDKDRVVRKSDGTWTYLAPDIAYHRAKFDRRFAVPPGAGTMDRVIDILGPDHHGYIGRIKAAVAALGYRAEALDVIIAQLVTLYRRGEQVRMSTRAGEFITLRELLDEVGVDATRFFYLMRKCEAHLDFDLELAKQQSPENPVYYIQYAHARICSILGFQRQTRGAETLPADASLERLVEPEELDLIRRLRQFPLVVESCVRALEPYGLTAYLQRVADQFHVFYTRHRVVIDDLPLSQARLALVDGARQVIRNGLGLLGISAPEQM